MGWQYLDMTNDQSVVEENTVTNMFFNRDERFAYFKDEYLQEEIADLESIQDRTLEEDTTKSPLSCYKTIQ